MDSSPASPLAPRDPSSPESSIGRTNRPLYRPSCRSAGLATRRRRSRRTPGRHRRAGERRHRIQGRVSQARSSGRPQVVHQLVASTPSCTPEPGSCYVLDGVVPPTWTADQLAARDDAARESSLALSTPPTYRP
ncbi:BZ3500_MvSof-1268-A1-R1_C082g00439 [Microbotryum saponariae]|uniref:BZ3500_MvSof-1268-A1-R1_C082g00439 protein n=1 Tax=Microbotryum saponariae TaxID=289078 RepID=A0A2X0N8H8_9BASI|nr:BZ3500_MvSof-1268-A1-R1_C082g00439 [Microbotryum saponariae]